MKYDGIVIYSNLDGTLLDKERKLSKTIILHVFHRF
jgi:hydroxymethylpyrimidine pyrophosphatase-like HAD family hydrolase